MKPYSRRVATAIAAAIVPMLALAGCGGDDAASDEKPSLSSEPVTLRLSWWGNDARAKMTKQVVEMFQKENPNITVETSFSDWGGYWDKLATEYAGGNSPDVFAMDPSYLGQYAANDSLYDLGKVSDFLSFDKIESSVVDTGKVSGTQYAAPISTAPFGVIINNDILDKYGVSLPDTSKWTWNEFEEVCNQITEKSHDEITGALWLSNSSGIQLWSSQQGEQFFKDGKVAINADTLARFFEKAKDWTDNGISGSADRWSENMNSGVDQSDFGTGKQAMIFSSTTQIVAYSGATGTENLTLAPMPSDSSEKWNFLMPGVSWTMSSQTKHPAEAAKLIDYFINNVESGKVQGTDRGIPVNSDVRKAVAEDATGVNKKSIEFMDSITSTLGESPEISPAGTGDLDKVITRHEQDVVFGNATPAEAAKSMIEELNTAIQTAS